MYELRRDGEAPLWRPRVDGRALASTSAPSLLGLSSVSEQVRATRAKQHKSALLPPSDPRCRPSGLARLAVAKTPWRRGPQPSSSA